MECHQNNRLSNQIIPLFSLSKETFIHFNPLQEIVICCIEYKNTILLIQRSAGIQKHKWCFPGGKVESRETIVVALQRELQEELGWQTDEEKLHYQCQFYERIPSIGDYILHLFYYPLQEAPQPIQLSPKEHTAYRWVPKKEFYAMDLMWGQQELYSLVKNL